MLDCARITVRVWGRGTDGERWNNTDSIVITRQVALHEPQARQRAIDELRDRLERELRDQGITIEQTMHEQEPCYCRQERTP
jgi:hypothetical protein